MAGIFGNMNPKTGLALQGLGLGLAQLDAGRTPNLSPIYAQLQEQDKQAQMQEAIGPALEGMAPGMRKVLAAMPPEIASQYIMKMMEPKERRIIKGADGFNYFDDGTRVLPGVEAKPPTPKNQFVRGVGVVDLNNPPENLMQGNFVPPAGQPDVKSSVILEDGTTIQSTDNGTRVFGPTGERLEGESAAEAIRVAREYEVANQQDIYGARRTGTLNADVELGGAAAGASEAGKQAIEFSGKAYESAAALSAANSTIDRALVALDNGAKAGALDRFIPNVTQASAELRNAMDQMGLDVIQATTFGALSEGEMRLAMETAVPRNLDEAVLREWLEAKAAANAKVHAMLTDAAVFLGTPGNTLADWAEQNRLATDPPEVEIDFGAMDNDQLLGADVDSMTLDQLDAWEAEMDGRGF